MDLDAVAAEISAMMPQLEERLRAMEPAPTTKYAAILAAIPRSGGEDPEKLGPFLGNLPKQLLAEVVTRLEGVDAANLARVNETCWNVVRPFEHWYFKYLTFKRLSEGLANVMLVRGMVQDPSPGRHDCVMRGGEPYFYDPLVPATLQEMRDSMRYILVTPNRADALVEAADFATGGQARQGDSSSDESDEDEDGDLGGGGLMFFNTNHGNMVLDAIPEEVEDALSRVPAAARFDSLLALTIALDKYDAWLHDNECGCDDGPNQLEVAVKKLGRAWRLILSCPNAQLCVDPEFTRPGVEAMLEDFTRKLADAEEAYYDDEVDLDFEWRPPEEAPGDGAPVPGQSHFDLLDETCERLGADDIFLTRRGDHVEDVESVRKVILTPGRKRAIEEAESFLMGGIQVSFEDDGTFEFHHKENSNKVCAELARAAERALAKPTPPEKFDALFALTRQLNLPHEHSGHVDLSDPRFPESYPPDSPGEWMTETDLWRPGQAMEIGVARLAAAWREVLGGHTNAQLCVDEAFSRPGVEAMLEAFQEKLNAFATSRLQSTWYLRAMGMGTPLRYHFNWRPMA